MSFLLHIDSSIQPTGSVSKELTGYFAERWRASHPDGRYRYRDLSAEPVPHMTHEVRQYQLFPDNDHEASRNLDLCASLVREVREATTLLLGVPMHNYTIPSTIKAWIDWIAIPSHIVPPGSDEGLLRGKTVIVCTARGGSYGPGTPREGYDYQEPYLRAVLGSIGLADDLTIVNAEMTLAYIAPPLAQFKPIAEQTKAAAYETLKKLSAA